MPAVQRAGRRLRPRVARDAGPSATATSGSSPARRCGRRGRTSSDFGVLLARTDPDVPKRKGITYFLVDLHQPGVEVRPLRHIAGEVDFNEVFLDGARVPDAQRVGDVGDGWKVANATLSGERQMVSGAGSGGVDRIGGSRRRARWSALARDEPGRWRRPGRAPAAHAACYSEERIRDWTNQRVRAGLKAGRSPGPESSIGKVHQGELNQRIQLLAIDLLGAGRDRVAEARRRPIRRRRCPYEVRGHAAQPGEHDRGRHHRGEQEHPRRAGARPAPRARPVAGRAVARRPAELMTR